MTFGEKLKKLRADKQLTVKEVAEYMGVSTVTYRNYENGKSRPVHQPKNYEKMAELYGCDVEYLKNDDTEEGASLTDGGSAMSETGAGSTAADPSMKETGEGKTAEKRNARKDSTKASIREKKGKEEGESEVKAKKGTNRKPEVFIELQYSGRSITYDQLVKLAKDNLGSYDEPISIYVKPEEAVAYYVSGDITGQFDI